MSNKWKEIWSNRKIDLDKLDTKNEFELYSELKRLDGFDVQIEDEYLFYKALYDSIIGLHEEKLKDAESIFEVGCGSGANLILFKNRGKRVGGVDYSKSLSSVAKEIVGNQSIITGEAIKLDSKEKFDAVISDSVFAYFTDIEYASEVLEKMYDKSNKQIILLEIFDKSLEDECNDYRRSLVEDYDEKYRGLDKLFFQKQMFIDFAEAHNCDIEFRDVNNDYYWNSRYLFNCFMRKRNHK